MSALRNLAVTAIAASFLVAGLVFFFPDGTAEASTIGSMDIQQPNGDGFFRVSFYLYIPLGSHIPADDVALLIGGAPSGNPALVQATQDCSMLTGGGQLELISITGAPITQAPYFGYDYVPVSSQGTFEYVQAGTQNFGGGSGDGYSGPASVHVVLQVNDVYNGGCQLLDGTQQSNTLWFQAFVGKSPNGIFSLPFQHTIWDANNVGGNDAPDSEVKTTTKTTTQEDSSSSTTTFETDPDGTAGNADDNTKNIPAGTKATVADPVPATSASQPKVKKAEITTGSTSLTPGTQVNIVKTAAESDALDNPANGIKSDKLKGYTAETPAMFVSITVDVPGEGRVEDPSGTHLASMDMDLCVPDSYFTGAKENKESSFQLYAFYSSTHSTKAGEPKPVQPQRLSGPHDGDGTAATLDCADGETGYKFHITHFSTFAGSVSKPAVNNGGGGGGGGGGPTTTTQTVIPITTTTTTTTQTDIVWVPGDEQTDPKNDSPGVAIGIMAAVLAGAAIVIRRRL